jgi:AcrR family transcriptional regulator
MERGGSKTYIEKRDESIRRILGAALEVFSQDGFAGARVDEIARRAGINKAMIYYRIGDKQKLYTEVLHHLFGDIAYRINKNISEKADPEEKLKQYIKNIAGTVAEHPHLPGIMMRELASGGSNVNEAITKDFVDILAIPSKIMEEGKIRNVFIDANPMVVHMMVVGCMMFFRTTKPVREQYLKKDLCNMSIKEGMAEIERLILRALRVNN